MALVRFGEPASGHGASFRMSWHYFQIVAGDLQSDEAVFRGARNLSPRHAWTHRYPPRCPAKMIILSGYPMGQTSQKS